MIFYKSSIMHPIVNMPATSKICDILDPAPSPKPAPPVSCEKTMKTLVMIKPDGVEMKCIGLIIGLIEYDGLQITKMKIDTLSALQAEDLYDEHKGKQYFDRNIKHVTSGHVVLMQVEGEDAITKTRHIVDEIRSRFDIELPKNLVHASSEENKALKELSVVNLS